MNRHTFETGSLRPISFAWAVGAIVILGCGMSTACGEKLATGEPDASEIWDVDAEDTASDGIERDVDSEDVVERDAEPDTADTGTDTPPQTCVENEDCRGGELCRGGICHPACTSGDECSEGSVCNIESNVCVQCLNDANCAAGQRCDEFSCVQVCASANECAPGQTCELRSGNCITNECSDSGDCLGGTRCNSGFCVSIEDGICTPGAIRCDGELRFVCALNGETEDPFPCLHGTACTSRDGNVECAERVCDANEVGCTDGRTAFLCNGSGTSLNEFPCDTNQRCSNGACEADPCGFESPECVGSDRYRFCDEGDDVPTIVVCTSLSECAGADAGCRCDRGECVVNACQPNSARCVGNSAQQCADDGTEYLDPVACSGGENCVDGRCLASVCTSGERVCSESGVLQCRQSEDGWDAVETCNSDQSCRGGNCEDHICTPGSRFCSASQVRDCSEDGLSSSIVQTCSASEICTSGTCVPAICTPDDRRCDGDNVQTCNSQGSAWATVQSCASGDLVCDDGSCVVPDCVADSHRCASSSRAEVCNSQEEWVLYDTCTSDERCDSGICVDDSCSSGSSTYCERNRLVDCVGGNIFASGDWEVTVCGDDETCNAAAEICDELNCVPNNRRCADIDTALVCNVSGSSESQFDCAQGSLCSEGICSSSGCLEGSVHCVDNISYRCISSENTTIWETNPCGSDVCRAGDGNCVQRVCEPNELVCADDNTRKTCNSDGTAWLTTPCAAEHSCTAGHCVANSAITATLTWDAADADLDLHVLYPGGTWFSSPLDCHYLNRNASWGTATTATVDIDDINGFGPEQITISTPEPDVAYRVGVHVYGDSRNNTSIPVTATVRVYVDASLIGTFTAELDNLSTGRCTGEFWDVGTVTYNSAGFSACSESGVRIPL